MRRGVASCHVVRVRHRGENKKATLGSVPGIDAGGWPDYNTMQEQIQGLTATCMIEAGWEYIPVQYPGLNVAAAMSSDEDEAARASREGLGVAYYLLNDGIVEDDTDWVDPNAAYGASLSEDEKGAYQDSLAGTAEEQAATMTTTTTTEYDPYSGTTSESTGSHSGCQGEAYDAVLGDRPAPSSADITAMKSFYQEVEARVAADPRTIELQQGWAACMKAQGYDYASREDFQQSTYAEFSAKASAVTDANVAADPIAGWTQEQIDEFWATATPEEIDALYNAKPELTSAQRTALEEILREEAAVGLQEHECSKDMDANAAVIHSDVEDKYVREHQDELTALALTIGGGS